MQKHINGYSSVFVLFCLQRKLTDAKKLGLYVNVANTKIVMIGYWETHVISQLTLNN